MFHFYHGEPKGRSYRQRHYMMMTQFPWMDRIITEDTQGLLSWVDVNHYFYEVMSKLNTVNNDPVIADRLFNGRFRFIEYAQEFDALIKKFEKYKKKYSQRSVIFGIIRDLIIKYSNNGGKLDD